jgi:uncharacterized DUF497 family protein
VTRTYKICLPATVFAYTKNRMEIEFDLTKDEVNRAKHGVPLAFGAVLFDDIDHIVLPSNRPIDGEARFKVIGMADGRLWTAVHVIRGTITRFISVRKSNDGEERIYRT